MKKILKKGSTLIELLIVIGILGILVAAVLLTINPAETQRKARDQQRLKDLGNLTAIIDQAVSDGKFNVASVTGDLSLLSDDTKKACKTSWATDTAGASIDICDYASVVPADPVNKTGQNIAFCNTGKSTKTTGDLKYYVFYDYSDKDYVINIRQESQSNCSKILNDGGKNSAAVETGTSLDADGVLDLITEAQITTAPTGFTIP